MDKYLEKALKAAQRDPEDLQKLAELGLAFLRSQSVMHTMRIEGRNWFSRTHGYTYHTATVYFDNKRIGKAQDYGDHDSYIDTGFDLAIEAGLIPERKRGRFGRPESVRNYEKRTNIRVETTSMTVSRKRDL